MGNLGWLPHQENEIVGCAINLLRIPGDDPVDG
jgi:hypothetical protein